MKIVICASVNFPEKIREVERGLKERGHEVVVPYSIIKHNIQSYEDAQRLKETDSYQTAEKPEFTRRHFNEIENGDAILVVNVEKNGIPDYIGGATFAEMMFAFYLGKKIFLLNSIPAHEKLAFFRDEIEAVQPVILNGNLDLVN
jgi:hypothetical protein